MEYYEVKGNGAKAEFMINSDEENREKIEQLLNFLYAKGVITDWVLTTMEVI